MGPSFERSIISIITVRTHLLGRSWPQSGRQGFTSKRVSSNEAEAPKKRGELPVALSLGDGRGNAARNERLEARASEQPSARTDYDAGAVTGL